MEPEVELPVLLGQGEPFEFERGRAGVLPFAAREGRAIAERWRRLREREVLDLALLAQHARQLAVQPRRRHDHVLVVRAERVPDAGQCICYRVTHLDVEYPGSPRRLGHARDHALVRDLAQADPAESELAVVRARSAAPAAPIVVAGLVLASALLADDL